MAAILRGAFRETGRALVEQSRGFSSQIRGNLIPRDFASKVLQFQTFDKSTQDQALLEKGLARIVPSHVKIDRNADIIPQLVHIHCATLKNTNPSATQKLWADKDKVGLPFYSLESDQHALVRVAVKHLNKPTAIIGVGTWSGVEIFQLLKAASASEKTRPLVASVSMVDANPLAVKIAQVSGHYLGLGSDRFISYQGNALEELPPVPDGVEYQQKMFIASRFLPVLTPPESSMFLQLLRGKMQDTDSHARLLVTQQGAKMILKTNIFNGLQKL